VVVNRDGYYMIHVVWKDGFKHKVPCRGYNLKSEMAFNDSLFWVESHNFFEVSKEDYEEYIWGSGSVADTEKTTSTSTTRSRRKSGQSEKTDTVKQSRTKQSAKTATKNTKKKVSSSTPTKKRSSGSTTKRKTDEHSKSKSIRQT
jgi:hypothetical protein